MTLVFNPEEMNTMRRVSFEEEGENGIGFIESVESYQFKRPSDNVYHIDIYTDHSVVVMYVNDVLAYTQRIYGIEDNGWSINNYSSTRPLQVTDLSVSVIPALQTVDEPKAYWEKTTGNPAHQGTIYCQRQEGQLAVRGFATHMNNRSL